MIELDMTTGAVVWIAVSTIASIVPGEDECIVYTIDGRKIEVRVGSTELRDMLNHIGVPPRGLVVRVPLP
jgi:hypothetical protein